MIQDQPCSLFQEHCGIYTVQQGMVNMRFVTICAKVILSTALLCWMTLASQATQVFFQRPEEIKQPIAVVLRVKVGDVKIREDRMKLKDGKEGPVIATHWEYQCDVRETVSGDWPAEKSAREKIRFQFTAMVPVEYDENGREVVHFSYWSTGSGIETSLQAGQEYLVCLPVNAPGDKPQKLLRAEPVSRRAALLVGLQQARARAFLENHHRDLLPKIVLAGFEPRLNLLAMLVADGNKGHLWIVDPVKSELRRLNTVGGVFNQIYFEPDAKLVLLRHNNKEVCSTRLDATPLEVIPSPSAK
jgi:hypothetical protein